MPAILRRTVIAALVAAGAAGAVLGAAQAASTAPAITAAGVGDVKVGARYATLRAARLLGKVQRGCELAGPQARAATLRPPLKGSVTLTDSSPRKVASISVRAGAKARGIGVGSTTAALRKAFPQAVFDRSTEPVFAITLVKIPKGAGGRLQFAVDTRTRKVTEIAIPAIAFCE